MKFFDSIKCGLILAAITIAGCGGKSGSVDGLVPAIGSVTLDNKPLVGAALTLIPQAGVAGRGGYGVTDQDGNFSLNTTPDAPGVVAGKYMVLLTKFTMPDGSPIPENMSAADAGLKNALPQRYADPSSTDVYVDFPPANGQPLVIGLKSKGR